MRAMTGYRITIGSELAPTWSPALAGMAIAVAPDGTTVLTGELDQAALHGVLATIRDLGVPLISLETIRGPRPVRRRRTERLHR